MTKATAGGGARRLSEGEDVTAVALRASAAWNGPEVMARSGVCAPPGEAEKHISDINRDDYVVTNRT